MQTLNAQGTGSEENGAGRQPSPEAFPDWLQTRTQLNLTATKKLNAQGTGSEEESVPRLGQKRRERF